MKTKQVNIYFIRHPEVENAHLKVFNGHTDVDLSKEGYNQAYKLALYFENKGIERIYTSPLKRCKITAQIIARQLNCPIIVDKRLKERKFGIFESYSWQEIEQKYPLEASSFLKDPFNFKIEGGESFFEVYDRVSKFLADLDVKKNTLIVAHGGVNRVLVKYILGITNDKILSISQDFACVNHVLSDGENFLVKLINGIVV